MGTITTFCRITGHARNLPKPCYFPLLPPISPADAKKLCRITGKAQDSHNYCPIIAFGKTFNFTGREGCRITKHEDLCYTRPTFIIYKDNVKTLEFLTNLLGKMKKKKKSLVDMTKHFVYRINDNGTNLVLPPEFEEAIRTGEIEYLSMHKDIDHLTVKIKQGRIVKVKVETMSKCEIEEEDNYFYGEGQSKEALFEQQKVLNDRNLRKKETMARKKVFEQKEQKAEEDEKKSTERPKSKKPPIKFDPLKRKLKLEQMGKMIEEHKENTSIILPKFDPLCHYAEEQIKYEKMLDDLTKAQKKSINVTTVLATNFDWSEINDAENAGFDWDTFPHEDIFEAVEISILHIENSKFGSIQNVFTLDIAASVQRVESTPVISQNILNAIKSINEENLRSTEINNKQLTLWGTSEMLPKISDVIKIVSSDEDNLKPGYLVKDKQSNKTVFVRKVDYNKSDSDEAIQGAEIVIDGKPCFVIGQIIQENGQDKFVAGQTMDYGEMKQFVPGQTIVEENGRIAFIPGQTLQRDEENIFVAGRIVDGVNGSNFIPGQMLDRGDGKSVFVSGQTILTGNGPKFVPGEYSIDQEGYEEFVPGLKMPTTNGEKFIPGQVFQSEEGITFVPGQIIDTDEGPSFVSGKTFTTPEGDKKFVKGEIVKNENGQVKFKIVKSTFEKSNSSNMDHSCLNTVKDSNGSPLIMENGYDISDNNERDFDKKNKNFEGTNPKFDRKSIIPNDHLQLSAITGKNIAGFIVKPTNTSNIPPGKQLYGDIVHTEDSVLFYNCGELPDNLPSNANIISGQLLVGEDSQRFVYGKTIDTANGEKFVPGQMVKTNHGEEFVPGQIVVTNEGPKFVPGQLVMTSEGEKFIPGQVVFENDGPKFVPGQIIHTKNGATFIPGQMMTTEKGQKFVPGQLVDTKDGPRFVPGQVVETETGPEFVPGTVVETDEGLKFLPNVAGSNNGDDSEEESEISFQAFDISPEEALLIASQSVSNITDASFAKELASVDSSTLKKLASEILSIHKEFSDINIANSKTRKKKQSKITIDALDDDDNEEDEEDSGTDKVEILKLLVKVGTNMSTGGKEEEMLKLSELLHIDEHYDQYETEIEAIKFINSNHSKRDLLESYIGNDESLITAILGSIGNIENLKQNDEVTDIVNKAVTTYITKMCDEQINEMINKIVKNPETLYTDSDVQILLTEAVGIVCVTGDVEVASLLEKFISEPTNPKCLKEDQDVLNVLRQLLVLHRVAERDPEVLKVLQELQDDPEGVSDRNKIRRLIREAKLLLGKEKKKEEQQFNIRHVTSSKDIPKEIFEQIRRDKDEAERFMDILPNELFEAIMKDKRCGERFFDSLDIDSSERAINEFEKFKKGMAVVITKDDMQAVIPKHLSRSIYYGIMPYLLLDEEGFKFFERGLTGRKLAPSRVIENTWFRPDDYYDKSILYPQRVTPSGMQYNLVFLGNSYPNEASSLQYTSLLPSSGPKRISYLDSQRFDSRSGSVTPLRRSCTPARRVPGSLHENRNLTNIGMRSVRGSLSPAHSLSDVRNFNSFNKSYSRGNSLHPLSYSENVPKFLDRSSRHSSPSDYRSLDRHMTNSKRENGTVYTPDNLSLSKKTNQLSPLVNNNSDGELMKSYNRNGISDSSLDNISNPDNEDLQNSRSNNYEGREPSSPFEGNDLCLRNSLIETAKKNRDALSPLSVRSCNNGVLSNGKPRYTDRLKELRNQNGANISSPCRSFYNGEIDEDNISDHVFRNSLKQKYNDTLSNMNNSYKHQSYSTSVNDERSPNAYRVKDMKPLSTLKYKQYGDEIDRLNYPTVIDTTENIGRFSPYATNLIVPSNSYNGYYNDTWHIPKEKEMGLNDIYHSRIQAPLNGYSSMSYHQPVGYETPSSYGHQYGGRNYGSTSFRESSLRPTPYHYNSAGRTMSYGYGLNPAAGSYQGARYGSVPPIISRVNTLPHNPLNRGKNRKLTLPLDLSDDDDNDLDSYDPKAEQRHLASEIAKKYLGESESEDE